MCALLSHCAYHAREKSIEVAFDWGHVSPMETPVFLELVRRPFDDCEVNNDDMEWVSTVIERKLGIFVSIG